MPIFAALGGDGSLRTLANAMLAGRAYYLKGLPLLWKSIYVDSSKRQRVLDTIAGGDRVGLWDKITRLSFKRGSAKKLSSQSVNLVDELVTRCRNLKVLRIEDKGTAWGALRQEILQKH